MTSVTHLYNHLVITATSKKHFINLFYGRITTIRPSSVTATTVLSNQPLLGKKLLISRWWHLIGLTLYSSANKERYFCFCVNMLSNSFRIYLLQFIERTHLGQVVPQDGHTRLTSQTSCILCFTSTKTLPQVM